MVVLALGCIPIWACFQFLGICLFVFFLYNADPVAQGVLDGTQKAEIIMPHFIMNYLPAGFVGLVIAGAFAAAMSTLSACINVASMVSLEDLYKKYVNPGLSDRRGLWLGKLFSALVALAMIAGALLVHAMDTLTLLDLMLSLGVIVTIGIPSIFIAGMFTRRIGTCAIWVGVGSALALMGWVMLSNANYVPDAVAIRIPAYYVSVLGNVLALGIAWAVSIWVKARPKDLTNLTVWDQTNKPLE